MRELLMFPLVLYCVVGVGILLGWLLDDCDPWWGFVAAPLWGIIVIYGICKHTLKRFSRPTPRTDG